jgi:hypothetical protein
MAYEIIEQVKDLFGDKDQYYSFLDIVEQKPAILASWWRKFMLEMHKSVGTIENWGYSSRNHLDYHWYINELGIDSFSLVASGFGNKFSLSLWAPQHKYDIRKLSELLQESRYAEPIKAKFDRLDYIGNDTTELKFAEHIIFEGSTESEFFDLDRQAWYANYKTSEFVSQVISKINRFREDIEIKDILMQLNRATLIK